MDQERLRNVEDNPRAMEALYRSSVSAGDEHPFREALGRALSERPKNVLLQAWAVRLDLPLEGYASAPRAAPEWQLAVGLAMLCGLALVVLRAGKPPVPVPEVAASGFWIGWAPLLGAAIVVWLAAFSAPLRQHLAAGLVGLAGLTLIAGTAVGQAIGASALLCAIHLPFAVWLIIGATVVRGRQAPALQFYAYIVKSMETVLTAGIYFAAFGVFIALTAGIFAALDIQLSATTLQNAITLAIGAAPLLALASVWNAHRAPLAQDWDTGQTRLVRVITRVLLPLALTVLTAYVLYFIPVSLLGGPLAATDREILIVYNVTIIAILMLIAGTVAGKESNPGTLLYAAILATVLLTLCLNLYALGAIAARALDMGITPNRHAVLGWNAVTAMMLGYLLFVLVRGMRPTPFRLTIPADWKPALRAALAKTMMLPAAWTLWVIVALPLLHAS